MMDYKKIITNKKTRLRILNMLSMIPDKRMLQIEYRIRLGQKLNLDNPKTFTEKLQWLKLYNRKSIYTTMVDKYGVKKFISDLVGSEYTVPTLGVWEKFEDIDFSTLPLQFVLKCTHDSGSVIVCNDKNKLNMDEIREHFHFHLNNDEYILGREWPYKDVPRRIICEPLLTDVNAGAGSTIKDYKFFCFNGVPKVMYISNDRGDDPRTDFFDMDFNHLPIRMKDPNADIPPKKPGCFETMKSIAGKLSLGVPHLRVDFYVVNNRPYVGELTFFHNSGFTAIQPDEWNKKLGDWIELPSKGR